MTASFKKYFLPDARTILFFIITFCILAFGIDTRILYHGYGVHGRGQILFPAFSRGYAFFAGFLAYPGGILDYFSAFTTHILFHNITGSLIITLSIAMLYRLTKAIFSYGGGDFSLLYFIPAVFALIGFNQYLNVISVVFGMSMTLGSVWAYSRFENRHNFIRIPVYSVVFCLLYYTAGVFSLVFALLACLRELLKNRSIGTGIGLISVTAALWYAFEEFLFFVPIIKQMSPFLPWRYYKVDYRTAFYAGWALYCFYPLLAVWYRFRPVAAKERSNGTNGTSTKNSNGTSNSNNTKNNNGNAASSRRFIRALSLSRYPVLRDTLLLIVMLGVTYYISYDSRWRALLKVNYYSRTAQWEPLLSTARAIPLKDYSTFVNHEVNKALFATGQLQSRMFAYPQNLRGFVSAAYPYMDLISRIDTYFGLGFVNHAERQAFEALEMVGVYPVILQKLFYITMAKGDVDAAREFLYVLLKDINYKPWAEEMLATLSKDPTLANDPELIRIRSARAVKDYNRFLYPLEERVGDLVEQNINNEMALEFEMAILMLTRQVGKIAEIIDTLPSERKSSLPRYYREALFIDHMVKNEPVDGNDQLIGRETIAKGSQFLASMNRYGRNIGAAENTLRPEFGDSYFFYYIYRKSGFNQ